MNTVEEKMSDSPSNRGISPSGKIRCLPSEGDKIRESVEIGSVFLALESEFFTHEALLKWLTTVSMTERTQIAYKAVCLKIPPNKQYMDDTYHFLTKKPEYSAIAFGFGLSDIIPDKNVGNCDNPIIAHICDAVISLHKDANVRNLSALILAGQGPKSYIQAKLSTCCRARCFPHLRNLAGHEYNIALVAADWTSKFRYNEKLAGLIVRRVTELQQSAPIYYSGVAYKAYHKVAVKLNKDKLLTQLSRNDLVVFNTFFPGVIDQKILGYTDLAYKIALLGNDVAGYVLGFPIQIMIPSEDQIHYAIQTLTDQGSGKYVEGIKAYVASTYTPSLPFMETNKVTFSNETDVVMEDINNYVPFDIVSFQTGSHMYRFTRPEFDKLSESKKNPWTNEWLPPTVLSTIKARCEAVKELGLPPSRPLSEILSRVESGTLFESDQPESTPQQSHLELNQPLIPISSFLNLLMGDAMDGQLNPGISNDYGDNNTGIEIESQSNITFENSPRDYPNTSNHSFSFFGVGSSISPMIHFMNSFMVNEEDEEDDGDYDTME